MPRTGDAHLRECVEASLGGTRHGVHGSVQAGMMGTRWMPWRWLPRKDVATRRNARGRRWQPAIPGSPNGTTRRV